MDGSRRFALLGLITIASGLACKHGKRVHDDAPARPRDAITRADAFVVAERGTIIPCTQYVSPTLVKSTGFTKQKYDLLYERWPDLRGDARATLAVINGTPWGKTTLRVSFVEDKGSPKLRQWFQDAANQWGTAIDVSFQFVDDPNADIRVSFGGTGNLTMIGKSARDAAGGAHTMALGGISTSTTHEEARRVMLHEIGHALGAPHEHQTPLAKIRWIKQPVLDYYKATFNWEPSDVDAQVFHQYGADAVTQDQFDPSSIMIYPIRPDWNEDHLQVDLNENLSAQDIAFMRKIYHPPHEFLGPP